ncbi:MAG: hypothetical protein H8D43_01080 [Chloroflexi bacterium]|nr:hypothetical protein [Chloroflexota bacterium]
MSQIILDDQLFDLEVLVPIARWITVQRLRDLRPGEVIKDDRVPVLLRQLRQPTFVTIDMGFWNRGLRDARYCILCFPLRNDKQYELPGLLRRLLRLPEFRTKRARMDKVAQVRPTHIEYWQLGDEQLHRLIWPETSA